MRLRLTKYLALGHDGEQLDLQLGNHKGVNCWLRYRSAEDGLTPCLALGVFVWGTFLGFNPATSPRCASNGVSLVSWWIRRPHYPEGA